MVVGGRAEDCGGASFRRAGWYEGGLVALGADVLGKHGGDAGLWPNGNCPYWESDI